MPVSLSSFKKVYRGRLGRTGDYERFAPGPLDDDESAHVSHHLFVLPSHIVNNWEAFIGPKRVELSEPYWAEEARSRVIASRDRDNLSMSPISSYTTNAAGSVDPFRVSTTLAAPLELPSRELFPQPENHRPAVDRYSTAAVGSRMVLTTTNDTVRRSTSEYQQREQREISHPADDRYSATVGSRMGSVVSSDLFRRSTSEYHLAVLRWVLNLPNFGTI